MVYAWILKIQISWLKKTLLFIFDHWQILLVSFATIIIVFWFFSFCGSPTTDKIEKQKEDIFNSKVNERVAEIEANRKEIESNKALENVNLAINKDSNVQSNDFLEAKKRFCQKFCNDSQCAEYKAQKLCK